MIGGDGHLRLADFGLCKCLPNHNIEKPHEGDALSRKGIESSNADFGIVNDNNEQNNYHLDDDIGEHQDINNLMQHSSLAHALTNITSLTRPVFSIMVASADQMPYSHSISDELRFLNYLCLDVHNDPKLAAKNLRVQGLIDMMLIVIPRDTANSILHEQTMTHEIDVDNLNDFVSTMVVISSKVPNLPVVMVNTMEDPSGNSRLERYYSALAKRSGHANPVKVISAPVQTPNNVDLIAKLARRGRIHTNRAGNYSVAPLGTSQHPYITDENTLSRSSVDMFMSETARTQILDSLNTLDPTGTFTSQTSTSDGQHRHEEKKKTCSSSGDTELRRARDGGPRGLRTHGGLVGLWRDFL